jgi:hypothetical protein
MGQNSLMTSDMLKFVQFKIHSYYGLFRNSGLEEMFLEQIKQGRFAAAPYAGNNLYRCGSFQFDELI